MAQSEYSVVLELMTSFLTKDPIIVTVATAITLLISHFISNFISNWFEKWKEYERRTIWFKFLRSYSDSIDATLEEFMTYRSPSVLAMPGGLMLGLSLGLATFWFLGRIEDITSAMVHSTLISAIPFITSVFLMEKHIPKFKQKTKKMLNDGGNENYKEWLRRSKRIINIIDLVKWLAAGSLWFTFAIMLTLYTLYEEKNLQILGNTGNIEKLLLSVGFGFVAFMFSSLNHTDMCEILKSILTAKYSGNYPHVQIKTKFDKIEGFVADVLDEKLIVLRKNDEISAVELNTIANIKIINKVYQRDKKST